MTADENDSTRLSRSTCNGVSSVSLLTFVQGEAAVVVLERADQDRDGRDDQEDPEEGEEREQPDRRADAEAPARPVRAARCAVSGRHRCGRAQPIALAQFSAR